MMSSHLNQRIVLTLTSATLVFGFIPTVKAQNVLSPSQTQQVINGLSYPTGSQRFFEAGQRQFERELDDLVEGKYPPSESLLRIDEDLLRQSHLSPTELQMLPKKEDPRV
jgi:hypothetical protein